MEEFKLSDEQLASLDQFQKMENPLASTNQESESQTKALIYLLSDQDKRIAQTIHDFLVTTGKPALPYLKEAGAGVDDPAMAQKITKVVESICFSELELSFEHLVHTPEPEMDLEMGAFLIARSAYPELDIQYYQEIINEMAEDIRSHFGKGLTLLEKIRIVNQYLFKEREFKGNTKDYYDPENSYLNRVIDRRLGIPITLSLLYLLIGQRLNLPLYGVGMPGHFIVRLETRQVFIDCFNAGIILTWTDCVKFLKESGTGLKHQQLYKSPNHHILARMLRNLMAIFQKRHEVQQVTHLNQLLKLVEGFGKNRPH